MTEEIFLLKAKADALADAAQVLLDEVHEDGDDELIQFLEPLMIAFLAYKRNP